MSHRLLEIGAVHVGHADGVHAAHVVIGIGHGRRHIDRVGVHGRHCVHGRHR